eukprot:5697773-Pleurochrysis_carterae.AAC.1
MMCMAQPFTNPDTGAGLEVHLLRRRGSEGQSSDVWLTGASKGSLSEQRLGFAVATKREDAKDGA